MAGGSIFPQLRRRFQITGSVQETYILLSYMHSELILASGSPRRVELLERLGVSFRQIISGIEEEHSDTDPAAGAEKVAYQKAVSVLCNNPGSLVIGADTIVVSSTGEILLSQSTPMSSLSR